MIPSASFKVSMNAGTCSWKTITRLCLHLLPEDCVSLITRYLTPPRASLTSIKYTRRPAFICAENISLELAGTACHLNTSYRNLSSCFATGASRVDGRSIRVPQASQIPEWRSLFTTSQSAESLIRSSHTVSPCMSTKWDQIFTFGIAGAPSEAATEEAFGSACPRNLLPKSLSFSWTNTKYTSFSSASGPQNPLPWSAASVP